MTISSIVHIKLKSDTQDLDEIVVVGYGTQRKRDVTSSIAKVGGEELSNLAAPSFDTQLAGRAAGVQVSTPSGVLGSGPQLCCGMDHQFQVHTLFIVDGMPIATDDNGDRVMV